MPTVFRKIRQKLLEKSKVRTYLFYAIGEIFLVVIGILIALQINNTKDFLKEREQEVKVLSELLTSLQQNKQRLLTDSLYRATWNLSSEIVITAMEEKVAYSDSLNKHFQDARKPGTNLSLSYAGYEGLKNVGYNIISSDTLRKTIVELFELTHRTLLEEMEYFESFQPDRQTLIDQLFSYEHQKFDPNDPFNVPLEPHDYDSLLENETYLAMIKSVTVQRKMIANLLHENMRETERVIDMIRNELNKLQK
jgi:hypothetical protein